MSRWDWRGRLALITNSLCRRCGKQRSEHELARIGAAVICYECLASPVSDMPLVNQSGDRHHCSCCNARFPFKIRHSDNSIEEYFETIIENGKRYEVCTKCADEWERGHFHLIAGTPYAMEKYAGSR